LGGFNFSSVRVFRRAEPIDSAELVPEAALDPSTTDASAERLIRRADPDPPYLTSLQLLADGVPADSIAFATAADPRLRFRLADVGPGTVTAELRQGAAWTPLALARSGDEYAAALPPTLDGEVSLRVAASDTSGNTLTLSWIPAFVAVRDPRLGPPLPPGTLALMGARPNPAHGTGLTLVFSLACPKPSRLALYDVAGREVASRSLPAPQAGAQVLAMQPRQALRPGLYFARLEQDGHSVTARVVVVP